MEQTKPESKLFIDYETITVKIPTNIMNLLRFIQKISNETPESYIEYYIVENIRSMMDTNSLMPTAKQLTEQFNLNKVFTRILDDPVTEES